MLNIMATPYSKDNYPHYRMSNFAQNFSKFFQPINPPNFISNIGSKILVSKYYAANFPTYPIARTNVLAIGFSH